VTPNGITREMVLAAANGLRVTDPSAGSEAATADALLAIIERSASVSHAAGDATDYTAYPTTAGGAADGVMIDVTLHTAQGDADRAFTLLALTTTDAALTLSGTVAISSTAKLAGTPTDPAVLHSAALSGDVFVSAPVDTSSSGALIVTASGNATRTVETAPPTKVPISADEAAGAKALYAKKLKAAKKSYAKAKKKAGKNKRKKAKAKKSYSAKKATYKSAYRQALAGFRMVEHHDTVNRPFAVTISTDSGWALVH